MSRCSCLLYTSHSPYLSSILRNASYLVSSLLTVFHTLFQKKTLIDKFLIFFESLLTSYFTPFVYSCSSALSSVWFSEASASADWFVESLWCRNILIVQHSNGLHSTAVFYFSQLFLFSFRYNHFRGSRYGYPPPPPPPTTTTTTHTNMM